MSGLSHFLGVISSHFLLVIQYYNLSTELDKPILKAMKALVPHVKIVAYACDPNLRVVSNLD